MPQPPAPRRARQADIARLAGVSQATVSMVINGQGADYGISAETHERVLEAARELGYVANPVARSLRGKRTNLLGVHTFAPVFPGGASAEYLIGIEEQAVREGYDLVLFTSTGGADGQRRVYRDGANRLAIADGSVLLGVEERGEELARLCADGYPFVHVGRREVPGYVVPHVTADYREATAAVVERLAALGHRRIAYLAEDAAIEPNLARRAGYADGCVRAGLRGELIAGGPPDAAWLRRALADGATAVLAEGAELAAAVAALDVVIPARLSLVSLSDPPAGAEPPWSTLGIPRREMGRRAVRMLVEILAGGAPELALVLPCRAPDERTMAPAAQGSASAT